MLESGGIIQGNSPPPVTSLLDALKECRRTKDLVRGRLLHAEAVRAGFDSNPSVHNHLVSMYSGCRSISDAKQVFDNLLQPDLATWTSLIRGYVENGESELALEFFYKMQQGGLHPNARSYAVVVAACKSLAAKKRRINWLETAKGVHSQALMAGCCDVFVENGLIDMYSEFGEMVEAQTVFDKMDRRRDVVSWTVLIRGYVENEMNELALETFDDMLRQGYAPHSRAFVSVLKACAAGRSLERGRSLHAQAMSTGCCDIFVECTLVDMYSNLGSMAEARSVFDKMSKRNVVVWNALLQGYVENGDSETAIQMFDIMENDNECPPNAGTFVAALVACSVLGAAAETGSPERYRLLDKQQEIYSRATNVSNECNLVDLVQRKLKTLKPVAGTSISGVLDTLRECSLSGNLDKAKKAYRLAVENGLVSNPFVQSSLINMFARCGSMVDAQEVFDSVVRPEVASWNCLIQGYTENKEFEQALSLFDEMEEGDADGRTYVAALRACTGLTGSRDDHQRLVEGKQVHAKAVKAGFGDNIFVQNTLIDFYSRCGAMIPARVLFDGMKTHTVVSYNVLMQGYVEKVEVEEALGLFQRIEDSKTSCRPDARTYVAALSACADGATKERSDKTRWLKLTRKIHSEALKTSCWCVFVESGLVKSYANCGEVSEARRVFDAMTQLNLVAYNCLVQGYVENGFSDSALELIFSSRMESDSATLVAAVMACRNLLAPLTGSKFHGMINRQGGAEGNSKLTTCLLDFYGKCGRMDAAQRLFDSVHFVEDVWMWNSLMNGYCQQGDAGVVFKLFRQMRELQVSPNRETLIPLLSACSHGGLVDRGKKLFDHMKLELGIEPDVAHFNCLVDIMARGNHVNEALEVVNKMPVEANVVTWTSILEASRNLRDVNMGRKAYEAAMNLDDSDVSAHILMASIYQPESFQLSPDQP